MMRTIAGLSVFLFSALLATSCCCDEHYTVVGSGDVESIEVSVSPFHGVIVTGTCNVEVRTGETRRVELTAQPQVLDVMTCQVRDGILEIGFKSGYSVNTDEQISADIVVPEFSYAGITGAGDFHISGESQPRLDIYITGTGNMNAFGMLVEVCDIRITGVGNCEVNVTERLDVEISGVGNVYYMGQPTVTTDITGVGNVMQAGG
jgi:hypothetical protein